MTAENFDECLKLVRKDERGYSNHPPIRAERLNGASPHMDYDAYRKRKGERPQDVAKPIGRTLVRRFGHWSLELSPIFGDGRAGQAAAVVG
jgi:hypothetical protein